MTDIDFLIDLVRRAGVIAVAALPSMESETKADESLVTSIDRGLERMLRTEIAARFPDDAFYGEEEGGDPLAADRLWIADPIDGTANMAAGLPSWGVSLGMTRRGQPELGAFYMPITDEMFWFQAGQGAYRNETRLQIAEGEPLRRQDLVIIGSEAVIALDLGDFPSRQRNLGSLAAHWGYTASGVVRASVSVLDKLHDLGAVFGVAKEAGCSIEYLDGEPVDYASFLTELTNYNPILVGSRTANASLRSWLSVRPGWQAGLKRPV